MAVTPVDPNNSLYIFDNDAIAPRYPVYNTEQISNNAHAVWPSEQFISFIILFQTLISIELSFKKINESDDGALNDREIFIFRIYTGSC